MQIIRVTKKDNYTIISNHILRDKTLSLKARGLLCTIMTLPDDWDFTIAGMLTIIPETKGGLYKIIDELIEKGYCEKSIIRGSGKFAKLDYIFYEVSNKTIAPQSDSPHTEKPDTVKPHTAKRSQLNTNINQISNELNNNNKAENKKTFKEIKQERGIMTLEELVMEAINEETFMDRLMMNFGREKNMTVEMMKYYIKAIYSHWKYDLKLEHNNRREFRSHLINTINRDIFGNQRLYNQGIILLKNKKNTK